MLKNLTPRKIKVLTFNFILVWSIHSSASHWILSGLIPSAAFLLNLLINSMNMFYCWKIIQDLSSFIVCLWIKVWFAGLMSRRIHSFLEIFYIINSKEIKSSERKPRSYRGLNTKLLELLMYFLGINIWPGKFSWHFSFEYRRQFQIQVSCVAAVWALSCGLEAKTHLIKGLQAARHRYAG